MLRSWLWETTVRTIALAFSLFQLAIVGFNLIPGYSQRALHIGFALLICFILFNATGKKRNIQNEKPSILDLVLASAAIIFAVYTVLSYQRIILGPSEANSLDYIVTIGLVILILEASRRTLGLVFPILVVITLLYSLFGHLVPGYFGHPRFGLKTILETLYMTPGGLWGIVVSVSANVIAPFVILGALLEVTGAGQTFMNSALWMVGRLVGGPAKVATVASALFGMLNGNGPANVATTGVFTIPLMKKYSYPASFAGAVEAVASTGGQLMPPVMGASAFIMAEFLGIPYSKVALGAIIPSILYYVAVYFGVDFGSRRRGLCGLEASEIPKFREIGGLPQLTMLVGPVVVLIWLLATGYSAGRAGLWAVFTIVILLALFGLFGKFSNEGVTIRGRGRYLAGQLKNGLEKGGLDLTDIVCLIGSAQVVVSLINMTGVAVKFSNLLGSIGEGGAFGAILMAFIISIILGMGLPTAAAYVIGAAVVAPGMIKFGIPPYVAHMAVLYFTVLSAITPPVCTSVFVAASIAKENWLKVAGESVKMGIPCMLVPFIFIWSPEVILQGGNAVTAIVAIATAVIGVIMLACAMQGYFFFRPLSLSQRVLAIVSGGAFVMKPGLVVNLIGFGSLVMLVVWVTFISRRGGSFA